MRLLVQMYNPRASVVSWSGKYRRKFSPDRFVTIETQVAKLFRSADGKTVWAFGHLPVKYEHLVINEHRRPEGLYLFTVNAEFNKKTLQPFMESGLLEMDVGEIE